jgi:putative spermidine/putrescine transport system substrate-binding protein
MDYEVLAAPSGGPSWYRGAKQPMPRIPTLLAALLGLLCSPIQAQARDLTVVGFGGGFQDNARETLFKGYARQTGRPVLDDVYNGEVAKIYAMVRSQNIDWDVVMVEAPELVRGCDDGVFAPIDWSVIPRDRFVPGGATTCGAGAVGWGVGLFYDRSRIAQGASNYVELWDLERFPGRRSFRFGPKMTLEIALLADGVPPADIYRVLATPEGQDRAFAKLDAIKPQIVWWRSGTQPLQLVGSGEVAYAVGYVGRTARAAEEGADYPLLWSTLLYSFDYWAVVKGAPNAAEGMKLVDYMTSTAPLLELGQRWAVSPASVEAANNAGLRARNTAMVSNHTDEGLFIDTDFWVEYGDALEARFTTWAAR